jgi:hypothetical protein
MNAIYQYKKKLFSELSTLTGYTYIGESVPDDTPFPYIKISNLDAKNISMLAQTAYELTILLEIYDEPRSQKPLIEKTEAVRQPLENKVYILPNTVFYSHSITNCKLQQSSNLEHSLSGILLEVIIGEEG